eukprot:GHVN01030710.1.p1 GENE.GHVN01030710.1~~GHVN01030710.1.p1  ORF type:complete len:248 (+),score=9.36 GHVN01030710.1:105-848(+)
MLFPPQNGGFLLTFLQHSTPPPKLLPAYTSQRWFAGRMRGTKRLLQLKQARLIQTGWGKLMEFPRPARKGNRLRVPLYQNARPNLVYDDYRQRFLVTWFKEGQQYFHEFFTCGAPKTGIKWEMARRRAISFIEFMGKEMQGYILLAINCDKLSSGSDPGPDVAMSGVRGVYYDPYEHFWVARWHDGSKRHRGFSVKRMGFSEVGWVPPEITENRHLIQAFKAAVATRRDRLSRQYKFVPQVGIMFTL